MLISFLKVNSLISEKKGVMIMEKPMPVVVVSRCLGFEHCRWNGDMTSDSFVNLLKDYVKFIDICPESDIGLGIPRNPVRLVRGSESDDIIMVQTATGEDCTERMTGYSEKIVSSLQRVDGFLLKGASPSCGISNIKIYASAAKGSSVAKSTGLFTAIAQRSFPLLPFEDEGRLHNYILREKWLTAIFAISRLRSLAENGKISQLYEFHATHKYLLMSYNQTIMRELGHLLANHVNKLYTQIYNEYEEIFLRLLNSSVSIPKQINVLMHMMGYFADQLNPEEKQYFLNVLEEYRREAMPFIVPVEIIKNWAIRFDNEYIKKQIILQPYPRALMMLTDSGKGRNLRH